MATDVEGMKGFASVVPLNEELIALGGVDGALFVISTKEWVTEHAIQKSPTGHLKAINHMAIC